MSATPRECYSRDWRALGLVINFHARWAGGKTQLGQHAVLPLPTRRSCEGVAVGGWKIPRDRRTARRAVPTNATKSRGGGGERLAVGNGREDSGCDVIASLPWGVPGVEGAREMRSVGV